MAAAVRPRVVSGAGGVKLSVVERGDPSATTLLLVHGWPDSKSLWNPIAEALADRYHVVVYDVRGAGDSDHPSERDDYRVELLVDDMAAVIDAVSPDQPVHLVGHDWGSVQGWEAVTTDRLAGRVASFTSISGPSLDHSGYAVRENLTPDPRKLFKLADQLVRFSYILTFTTPAAGLLRRHGPKGRVSDAAYGMHMYLANIPQRLRRPNERYTDLPVLIIEATGDPVVRKASIDASMPWASNVTRRQIKGGHWVVRTRPNQVADMIAEFVG